MHNMLRKILDYKQIEIEKQKKAAPLESLNIEASKASRPFASALKKKHQMNRPAIIAEIKKASPSKGIIRPNFDPVSIAKSYQSGGASCLSVLTDKHFFKGSDDYISLVKEHCSLPVLRKDFIIDPYQIHQAKAIGADAILLIVAALDDHQLHDFSQIAENLDLDVLVESHDRQELDRALALHSPLIGVNNRDLNTFETDLQTSIDLVAMIPEDKILVSESGIHTAEDIRRLQVHRINCFLIGEALMREPSPGEKLAKLIG